MIWSNELLERVQQAYEVERQTYTTIAARLSEEFGEPIHPEQLRGAYRRFKARVRVTPIVTQQELAPRDKTIDIHLSTPLFKFGAVGDTHLCSSYEDLSSLHALYDIYQREGIHVVYHTGNWVDGEARFNLNDIHVRGMDAQMRYFIDNFPRREGIETQFISGDDHEGWYTQNHGIDIGQHLEDMARRAGRTDLVYLGYMEADVPVTTPDGDTIIIRVLHAGGGSSYALSHTSQKIVDSYDDYERPDILLVGHYHKAEYLPNYRGVRIIQTGTFQRQTPFMRKKRLHADIGGWIVAVATPENNVTRLSAEFINFSTQPWKHVMR